MPVLNQPPVAIRVRSRSCSPAFVVRSLNMPAEIPCPKTGRERFGGAKTRDLVVDDALRVGDQIGINRGGIAVLPRGLAGFANESPHGFAGHA